MQFSRPVQMRGKGLQQVPFPRLNPNRIQRSWQAQLQYSSRRAQEADGNYVTPSLRVSPFVANAIAVDLLQRGTFLRCHHGRLAATHSCATSRLHALVCAAARPAHTEEGIGGSIELPRCADSPPLIAHVIPLAVGQAVSIFDFDQPAAAVFVIDPAANFGRQIKYFATRFGLTTAETRVFEEIIRGKGLSAAAEQLKIGKATVHTHAIRIFAKTGTEGQAHLLRRFFEMSLPGSPGAS